MEGPRLIITSIYRTWDKGICWTEYANVVRPYRVQLVISNQYLYNLPTYLPRFFIYLPLQLSFHDRLLHCSVFGSFVTVLLLDKDKRTYCPIINSLGRLGIL